MMTYERNNSMDFIPGGDGSLVIFDPESGNTYILSDVSADVLNCVEGPVDEDAILEKLALLYTASREDMRPDVQEFLADMVEKGVLIAK